MTKQELAKRWGFFKKNAEKFQNIFGLRLINYTDVFTGFDIVKFDMDINTPDGTSIKDFIKKKYGEDAQKLIKEFIDL